MAFSFPLSSDVARDEARLGLDEISDAELRAHYDSLPGISEAQRTAQATFRSNDAVNGSTFLVKHLSGHVIAWLFERNGNARKVWEFGAP